MHKNPEISVVIPVYNEEAVIAQTYKRLKNVLENLKKSYEIVIVNDGSKDDTQDIIKKICAKDKTVKLVSFSRNFGHEIATTAGLDYSQGQAVIIIDADLQDPPELIPQMVEKWQEGFEVVYAKRIKRNGESLIKRVCAKIFYRVFKKLIDINIPVDTGDFRLVDRKVVEAIKKTHEQHRFMRGLISWVGFKQVGIEFVREQRLAGETKYSLFKLINLALDAIISFSHKPLKLASYIGITLSFCSFIYMIWIFGRKFFGFYDPQGWASMVVVNLFFNGITLMMLGIIGEYIARIYDEAKGRPLYIVADEVNMDEKNESKSKKS